MAQHKRRESDELREIELTEFDKNKKMNELDHLKSNIQDFLEEMDKNITPPSDLLPGIKLELQLHDYEQDLDLIKEETKETLDCISGLYLDVNTMKERNISNIIRNDAETICTIKFSIECAKRGLISCMKQLDAGTTNAEMYMAVSSFQKEIRDSSKMNYDLLTKMKAFYKELKAELSEVNTSGVEDPKPTISKNVNTTSDGLYIFDANQIEAIIEEHRTNPTLLEGGTF